MPLIMETIKLTREEIEAVKGNDESIVADLPESCGLLVFYADETPLFQLRTNNLSKLFNTCFREESDNAHLGKILAAYTKAELIATSDAFQALVAEKRLLKETKPLLTGKVRFSDDYVYLGINTVKTPYLTIQNDTRGEDIYIGPFRNRFELVETIETFAKLTNTPSCRPYFTDTAPNLGFIEEVAYTSDGKCPRERESSGYRDNDAGLSCPAYCRHNDDKMLKETILTVYLERNDALLRQLEELQTSSFEALQFLQAEEVKKQLQVVRRYYDMLKFLTVIKKLDYCREMDEKSYYIKAGVLDRITAAGSSELFNCGDEQAFKDYRTNELLALPKDRLQEMRTIYETVEEKAPELTEKLYAEQRKNITILI